MVTEFPTVVYLDVHKTGSTQIEHLLEHALGTPPIEHRKHAPIDARRPGKLHLISTRHPWEQYVSLFRFGRDGSGLVYRALAAAGRERLYDDFRAWLRFVVDPANAATVDRGWARTGSADTLGLMGYRYLRLAIADPARTLHGVRRGADADALLREHGVVDAVIENRRLESDLLDALRAHPEVLPDRFDAPAFADWMRAQPRRNVSSSPLPPDAFGAAEVELVAERESWLAQRFGYRPETEIADW